MKKYLAILLGLVFLVVIGIGSTSPVQARNGDLKLKVFVHEPKSPGKPITALSCKTTINDQVGDWLWAGWRMPASGVNYKINYSTKPLNLTNTAVYQTIVNSFGTWSAADAKQIFKYGGTTFAPTARYDQTNAILWKGMTSSAIAITYIWYYPSTGQLAEVDTVFNRGYKWAITSPLAGDCAGLTNTFDLQNIGTHEFGHWVGLDDLYSSLDKDLTMYGYGDLRELKKDTLGLGDKIGVNSILP